jgi:hypothetical protein
MITVYTVSSSEYTVQYTMFYKFFVQYRLEFL